MFVSIIILVILNIFILSLRLHLYLKEEFFRIFIYIELFTGLSFVIYPTYFLDYGFGLSLVLLSLLNILIFEKYSIKVSISSSFIDKLISNDKIIRLFPFVGLVIIVFQFFSSIFLFNKYVGNIDVVLVLVGLIWGLFLTIPNSLQKERDFFFIFINLLAILLVIPVIYQIWTSGYSTSYNSSTLIEYFLVIPLSTTLDLLGYTVSHNLDSLTYQDLDANLTRRVFIAQSCSGYYSVIIFISAFTSYIINESKKINFDFFLLLFIGIVVSYISNLIRMILIILTGHYYGIDALFWVHENIGWIIFSLWVAIFWFLMNNFFYNKK